MNNTKFSLIIPVYNEELNLKSLIKEILDVLKKFNQFEIIFIDDGSIDDSLKILKYYQNNLKFNVLENHKNIGQSFSMYKA